jgi:hypothetical protein
MRAYSGYDTYVLNTFNEELVIMTETTLFKEIVEKLKIPKA